jgi:hypothetical protein
VKRNILHATSILPLKDARYLGDYEAIVIDLRWGSLMAFEGAAPGGSLEIAEKLAEQTYAVLEQRSKELESFLAGGGVLVAKVHPASTVWGRGPRYNALTFEVDSTYWLVSQVYPLRYVSVAGYGPPLLPGTGHEIVIREVGHPLETVIAEANEYTGIVAKQALDIDGAVLLATTRIGDPIAAELPVGTGQVFLLPSGVDDNKLMVVLEEILSTRERHRQTWLLPEEVALIADENALRTGTRDKLKSLSVRQKALAELRSSAIRGNLNLSRAITYFENGTSASRPIKNAMQDLHKLVDLLEDYFGGSEDDLALGLGVTKSTFKQIKKLANQPIHDSRHAKTGEIEGPAAAEVDMARENARVLVQRFVEHCCDKEVNNRASAEHA